VSNERRLGLSHWEPVDEGAVCELTTGDLLRRAAELAPSTTALVEGVADPAGRRRWTYAEVLAEAETVAGALLGRFRPGERVAAWANNIPEWVLLQMGAALSGLTLVTVDPALRQAELQHVLGHSRAVGVFLRREYRKNPTLETLSQIRGQLPDLREVVQFENWPEFITTAPAHPALPDVAPDTWAQIQYTSGTTGVPKGVVLTHGGMVNSARLSFGRYFRLQQGESLVNPMPLFHTAGSCLITLSLIATLGTHVLMPSFDPELYLRLVEEERSVVFCGVPTMLMAALQHPRFPATNTSSVRLACSGGAPVSPDLVRRVEADLGVPMAIAYAQTEASPAITMTDPSSDSAQDRAESVGMPIPAVEVRIVDPADRRSTVPVGTVGELCTRGSHVMVGYLDAPEATAEAVDSEGWLHTGDLASMDARGYCRIEGRVKEMIIRGGENIFPREIEDVLMQYPGVQGAAVVGAPDAYWGEQVAAFIAPRPDATLDADELAEFCRHRLARHKVPRIWRIITDFPMTGSGKIRKVALRQRLADEIATSHEHAPN
jgi:fatty-acyl-CoA synthase